MAIDNSQRHTGVFYWDPESQTVRLLDLAWHCHLRDKLADDERYFWIDPIILPARLRQVAAMCRMIWRSNGSDVPYAFSQPSDFFDALTGELLLSPTRLGLTCATFVLAVFEAAGLRLIKYETWPTQREGDLDWQQNIVALLRQGGAANEHIEAVSRELGAARFRPEEVASAATLSPLPVSFRDVVSRSMKVLDLLYGRVQQQQLSIWQRLLTRLKWWK